MGSMRTVVASEITKAVRDLYSTCCIEVRPDYKAALEKARLVNKPNFRP